MLFFSQIKEVHEGKSLFVDYSSVLETAVPAAFGISSSRSVELATGLRYSFLSRNGKDTWYGSISWTFYFQKRNPWLKRFDWYLIHAEQAGLRNFWLDKDR